uniref:Transposase n=1 Tax=Ditylenchus dipsaci TaxID=166011 RepID=A0A915EQJ3_9BILA
MVVQQCLSSLTGAVPMHLSETVEQNRLGRDDQLADAKTDANGNFNLDGGIGSIFNMNVHFKIYHDCDRGILPCQRKVNLGIPSDYTTRTSTVTSSLMRKPAVSIEDISTIYGWLTKFKTSQGEANAIDVGLLQTWQEQVLRGIEQVQAGQHLQMDETGLFWQLLPRISNGSSKQTFAFRGSP